jgi:hypothetical protein
LTIVMAVRHPIIIRLWICLLGLLGRHHGPHTHSSLDFGARVTHDRFRAGMYGRCACVTGGCGVRGSLVRLVSHGGKTEGAVPRILQKPSAICCRIVSII